MSQLAMHSDTIFLVQAISESVIMLSVILPIQTMSESETELPMEILHEPEIRQWVTMLSIRVVEAQIMSLSVANPKNT